LESERAHDMIDLQVIIKNERIDYQLTKNVCKRLFVFRKQQDWPPFISKRDGWDTLYESQIQGLGVLQKTDEAIAWTNDFIRKIDEAVDNIP